MSKPHFGHTRHGLPVHLRTGDYPVRHGAFNRKVAVWLTSHVGTMRCFWLFCIIACLSLPATLHLAGFHLPLLYGAIPAFCLTFGWIYVDSWVTQNFIQLVLLPALMVGQAQQNEAADARSAKQFEDTEMIADRLDTRTQGGISDVLAAVGKVGEDVAGLATTVRAVVRALPPAEKTLAKNQAAKGTGT